MSKVLYCSKCGRETEHVETEVVESCGTTTIGTWSLFNFRRIVPKYVAKNVYKCCNCGNFNTDSDDGFLD